MANAPQSSLSQPRSVRSRLAQPKVVLLLLPLLVATVGGITGWIGYRTVAASARAMVESRVVEAAQQVRTQCVALAEEATTLSEHLADMVSVMGTRRDVETWGPIMAHCFAARPALTWMSVSYPDGTFIGMTNENHALEFTIQDQTENGFRRDWQWQAGVLTPSGTRTHTGYDPRLRPFYRLATERRAAAWTGPYRFFGSGFAGVSLARPLYTAGGELVAVVTVDYTTTQISAEMQRLAGNLGDRLLVYDDARAVVASAGMGEGETSGENGDVLTLADLRDPLAMAYARDPGTTGSRRTRDGREVHVASKPIDVGALPWHVAVITDLGPRLGVADAYLLRSALLTGLVVLIAGGMAAVYASHLVRMRGLVRRARAVAAEAKAEAAEFGSYVLEKKLGNGGMGEVWRARHRLLARPAALKLIKRSADNDNDDTAMVRFEQEARITASLTSQHTVTVFDFGILDDGTCYYVMELLDGDDLDGFLKQNRLLPPEAVVEILLQVCDSLHEAHEAGLVHRDLKPANIFIARMGCDDHVVKVLDFGLVALAGKRRTDEPGERLTIAGFVQGTPGFMAPEQLRDEPLDRRSDVYALGCVAFWLLTGRAVFVASNLMDELRQHLDHDPPAPSTVASQPIPPPLDAIILACLARDPAHRPASAQELADRLRRCGVAPAFSADLWGPRARTEARPASAAAVQLRVKGRRPGVSAPE